MPLGGLVTAGLIAGVATSGTQLGLGIADSIKGKRTLKKAQSFYEKNKYEVPESAEAALDVAQRQAQGLALPGEDIARERIGQTTSQAIGQAKQAATSSSDVLGMLASVYGNQMLQEQGLVEAGAARYDAQQGNLQNALNTMAGYEDQKWQYNVLYPYQQMLGQAEAYQSRGREGIGMGLAGLGQTASMYGEQVAAENQYADWYGNLMGRMNPNLKTMTPIQPTRFAPSLNTKTLSF